MPLEFDLDWLADEIGRANRPLHIHALTEKAVLRHYAALEMLRPYSAGAQYALNQEIVFKQQRARVIQVRNGGNPLQGTFQVLTLKLDNQIFLRAAAVQDAPVKKRVRFASDKLAAHIRAHLGENKKTVRAKLQSDSRYVSFQDEQGESWCLRELLPRITEEEIAHIYEFLTSRLTREKLVPLPTHEILERLGYSTDAAIEEYALHTFAVNVTCSEYDGLLWTGRGWVLEEEWKEFQSRSRLVSPRQPNRKFPAIVSVSDNSVSDEDANEGTIPATTKQIARRDFETWLTQPAARAFSIVQAKHYYSNTLPLTSEMLELFPPLDSGKIIATLYLHFGSDVYPIVAAVDLEGQRITATENLYDLEREHKVYPGTRLEFMRRASLYEIDVRPVAAKNPQPIRVVRFAIENNQLIELEDIETPTYEVDAEVTIADARWEDLPTLFRKAEEAGAGIFTFMFEHCQQLQRKNLNHPILVTAQQLFQEVHYNKRPTTLATIQWELWRRRAFESQGKEKYLFRPEMGDGRSSLSPSGTKTSAPSQPKIFRKASPRLPRPMLPRDDATTPRFKPSNVARKDPPHAAGDAPPVPHTQSRIVTQSLRVGQVFETLAKGSGFAIETIEPNEIHIRLHDGGQSRRIDCDRLELAWLDLVRRRKLLGTEIQEKFSRHSWSYIAAILGKRAEVRVARSPIELIYSPPLVRSPIANPSALGKPDTVASNQRLRDPEISERAIADVLACFQTLNYVDQIEPLPLAHAYRVQPNLAALICFLETNGERNYFELVLLAADLSKLASGFERINLWMLLGAADQVLVIHHKALKPLYQDAHSAAPHDWKIEIAVSDRHCDLGLSANTKHLHRVPVQHFQDERIKPIRKIFSTVSLLNG